MIPTNEPWPVPHATYTQSEWDTLRLAYPPGTTVSGEVVYRQPFGVFVRLDKLPNVAALLEVVCFAINEQFPKHQIQFEDYPAIGTRIDARILHWHKQPKEVRLTQLNTHDWASIP